MTLVDWAFFGKRLKRMGLRKGFPDLMLLKKKGDYGALFIELKVDEKSYVSHEQREWIKTLNNSGYLAKICYGYDDGKAFIESYLAIK